VLDTGFGMVPAADAEERFERVARTVWRLYRYRGLFRYLLWTPPGVLRLGQKEGGVSTQAEVIGAFLGPDEATRLLALRARYDTSGNYADFLTYVDALRGPEYLLGLRERWRGLSVQPIQIEALRRVVAHARAAGGRPAWVLMPENPIFQGDPEVGALLVSRSDEVTAALRAEAERLDVPLLDLRRVVPPAAFIDLNHLAYGGEMMPFVAAGLAERHLF
jgi:hypothetical protein